MKSSQWPGLVTHASPFAIPPTAAVDQVNLASDVPGQVYVRGGMRKVAVAGGIPDIIDCFPYEVDGKPAIVAMLPDGTLVARQSPAYGWQARVPLDPSLSSSGIVASAYTQRFVEGGIDESEPSAPDEDPNAGLSASEGESCEQALNGGSSASQAAEYLLDAMGCEGQELEADAFDGGTASTSADCREVVEGLCLSGDATALLRAPSSPRNLAVQFGSRFARLSWNPPSRDGGSVVLGYEVQVSIDGGITPNRPPPALDPPVVIAWRVRSATISLLSPAVAIPSDWVLDLQASSSTDGGVTWT